MRFISARQAIRDAYSGRLAVVWDADALGSAEAGPQLYCPECRCPGVRPVQGKVVMFRCGRCKAEFRRPLAMTPRGAVASRGASCAANDNRICNALEAGRVQAVVEAQPPAQRMWLLYAYTDAVPTAQAEGLLLDHLCDALDKSPPCDICGLGALKKAVTLLLLMIQEARATATGGRAPLSSAQMAAKIGVDRSQFSGDRLWGRFRDAARRQLRALDCAALEPVESLVTDMRGRDVA